MAGMGKLSVSTVQFTPNAGESGTLSELTSIPRTRPPSRFTNDPNAQRSGRARFYPTICTAHPEWEVSPDEWVDADNDHPCAKFSFLPGHGKGVHQPTIVHIITGTVAEVVKPLILIGFLIASLYGADHFLLHGNFTGIAVRSQHGVSTPAPRMPNSSEHTTNSNLSTVRPSAINSPTWNTASFRVHTTVISDDDNWSWSPVPAFDSTGHLNGSQGKIYINPPNGQSWCLYTSDGFGQCHGNSPAYVGPADYDGASRMWVVYSGDGNTVLDTGTGVDTSSPSPSPSSSSPSASPSSSPSPSVSSSASSSDYAYDPGDSGDWTGMDGGWWAAAISALVVAPFALLTLIVHIRRAFNV